MDNSFLPQNYETPTGNYSKFQDGDNRFRILSRPIIGWEDWKDKKPYRFRMYEKPEFSFDPEKPVKHFWAMVVWDYRLNKIAILQVTQKSIQVAIEGLVKSNDWGSPLNYDINIRKEGTGMQTEYSIIPIPPKPVNEEISALFVKSNINLEALFDGKDPFSGAY